MIAKAIASLIDDEHRVESFEKAGRIGNRADVLEAIADLVHGRHRDRERAASTREAFGGRVHSSLNLEVSCSGVCGEPVPAAVAECRERKDEG